MDYKKFTLPNGLTVLYKRTNDKGLISCHADIEAGWIYETGKFPAGTAHFLEHVAGTSTIKYFPGMEDYLTHLLSLGLAISTGPELIKFTNLLDVEEQKYGSVLSEDLTNVLMAFKGFLNPDFTERVVESERKRILQELLDRKNSEYLKVTESEYKHYFGKDYPYAQITREDGVPEAVSSIKLEHLKRFQQEYLTPNRTTLYLAGDVPEGIEQLVNEFFSELKPGDNHFFANVRPSDKMDKGRHIVYHNKGNDNRAVVTIAFPGPATQKDELWVASQYLSVFLGQSIFESLSQNKGLAYDAWCTYDVATDKNGLFKNYAKVELKNTERTFDALWETLSNFRKREVPQQKLEKIVEMFKRNQKVYIRKERMLDGLLRLRAEHYKGADTDLTVKRFTEMTVEDVLRVADRLLPSRESKNYLEMITRHEPRKRQHKQQTK